MKRHAIASASGVLAVILAGTPSAVGGYPPTLTSFPQVNATRLTANDTTQYTVSLTASDADGYNDIRCLRVLFNYTEAGGDQANGRGYMNWGKTDADVTQWGGTWVIADAVGGGRWAYRSDAWGGTTYITPVSCETSTSGAASGGSGSRTVTWVFRVKSAWAFNPVMNDADGWAADASYIVGWMDGLVPFDVVAGPCYNWCNTPPAPVISNPTANSVDIAIHPGSSSIDLFAITVTPSVGGRMYLQSDGSLGTAPRWYTKSEWGTKRVSGLMWHTTYTFCVRASRSESDYCPSPWSNGAMVITLDPLPVIDPTEGTSFSPWVRGQCPYRSVTTSAWPPLWDLTMGSMGRGLAGGLDADTYDWRNIDSGSGWGTPVWSGRFTTLELLQAARDHNAAPMLTANAFGGGYRDWDNTTYPGVFVCQFDNPDGLAADWVRYTNMIVQNYRSGDEGSLSGEDLRVYNSISSWGGKAKLLAPGEGSVPAVQYWEIGNEPELGGYGDFLSEHYLSPTDYRDRYKLISQAMRAVDPALKFGPCLINPSDPNSLWLPTLAADAAAQVDFVSYHPYYSSIKSSWGYSEGMATALRDCKAFLHGKTAGIRSILGQYGRNDCDLVASEWNPVNWDAPGYMQSSMANALGVVESCFSFADDGVLAATFWEQPQSKLGVSGAFTGLVNHMGDVLVTSSAQLGLGAADTSFSFYVTRSQADSSTVMIWGLNFDDQQPVSVNLALQQPCWIVSATLKHYGKPGDDAHGGDTSLTTSTGMAWDSADVAAGFDTSNFSFTMEDAEITVLVLQISPTGPMDFDRDQDVDQEDFGRFQRCFSGPDVEQPDEACRDARLDGDDDVDEADFAKFLGCMRGPGAPALSNCLQ